MEVKVGCCGFPVARSRYFEEFGLVEIQKTFYRIPREGTLRRWREEAPDGFSYTMKAWGALTHEPKGPISRRVEFPGEDCGLMRPTECNLEAWGIVKRAAEILGAEVVVIQSPPSFRRTEESERRVREFFDRIAGDLAIGWEVRHESWLSVMGEITESYGVIHVVDPIRWRPASPGPVVYFRLHGAYVGGRIRYNYSYRDEELVGVVDLLRELEGTGAREAYVLFNNGRFMMEDARRFSSLLRDYWK